MQGGFTIDPNPGWQAILQWLHDCWGYGKEDLLIFSIVFLMLLVMFCALPWFRRPEAWLAALLAVSVFVPECAFRFARGRPYILTDAVLITLLFLWSREKEDQPHRLTLILTPILIAASAWIQGTWYLLALPGAAILFTGLWRSAFWYGGCWLIGSFLGCALTGHPWEFLFQAVKHMFNVFHFTVSSQLAGELQPSNGGIFTVLLIVALLLWRAISPGWNPRVVLNPIFMMMVLGWLLGLGISRFWWDWGTPAFMIWAALELQDHLERHLPFDSAARLLITLGLAIGAFLGFTSDRDSRWTDNPTKEYVYLTPANPNLAGWLPEPGGIVYNSDMDVFYEIFFKNPTAPWRYVLGFEPGLMLPENMEILRKVQQWDYSNACPYEQWVKKMRSEDRMIIRATYANGPLNIPELEWNPGANHLWIGRLPRLTNNPPATLQPHSIPDGAK